MSGSKAKINLKTDIANNRIIISGEGSVDKEDLDKLYTDFRFSVADLKPGFDIITDLRGFKLIHLSGYLTLRKIMTFALSKHVSRVVRVSTEKGIIIKQFLNIASRIQGYNTIYVESMDEAEAILSEDINRKGTRLQLLDPPIQINIDGTSHNGSIVDISISGCKVSSPDIHVSEGQELLLSFSLKRKADTVQDFEIKARVVRFENGIFAVTYIETSEQFENDLSECLIFESQH